MPGSQRDAFVDAVRAHVDGDPAGADLEFRPGGWQVKIAGSSVKGVLGGALLAGLLVAVGATGIPAAVLAAIVPALFDVEKVRLTAGQEYILADLVGRKDAFDGSRSPDELYEPAVAGGCGRMCRGWTLRSFSMRADAPGWPTMGRTARWRCSLRTRHGSGSRGVDALGRIASSRGDVPSSRCEPGELTLISSLRSSTLGW